MWPIDWRALPGRRARRADRDDPHRVARHAARAACWRCRSAFSPRTTSCRSTPLNLLAKLILVSSRSVNSLVWALLFVGIFGPGALAGTLAIAFRSIGFVGKLFGEALEEAQRGPDRGADRGRRAVAVAHDLRLLAAGEAGVLVDRAVPLGHQRARVGGAGPGRRRRHRHGARLGAESVPVGPRGADPDRDLRRRDRRRDRRHAGAQARASESGKRRAAS